MTDAAVETAGEAEAQPQPVPVNGLFGSDFVSHLILLDANDSMVQVAEKVAHHAVGKRVAPRDAEMAVYFGDRRLPPDVTVAQAGIGPLQFVFVDYVDAV
ncbi:MAG TPA: toluene-4-monooxygenase system B family protein [Acidimicrobiales bacterium]|jgi:toluene monooxygenase system protein B|nr:toluene-4-monooxygenase system B family protein [Acidimicrobiales bacterium]